MVYRTVICVLLVVVPLIAGCGFFNALAQREPEDEGTIGSHLNPDDLIPHSLEQMIWRSDVIVRASLLSFEATTETVSGEEGYPPTYRPVHKLRFTAHEYLKGSGSDEILVVVRSRAQHNVDTVKEARERGEWVQLVRTIEYDDRQAILFLIPTTNDRYRDEYDMARVVPQPVSPQGIEIFSFNQYEDTVNTVWEYSIDSRSRVWLPASSPSTSGGASGSSTEVTEFMTGEGSHDSPTISVTELRTEKTELEAMLKKGEGIEGYERCIQRKLANEQIRRADSDWPTFLSYEKTLGSGLVLFQSEYAG